MIFERFSLERKKPELCYIKELLNKIITFFIYKLLGFEIYIYILALVISFLLHNNLIHKAWVGMGNKRQDKTQSFLGKIIEFHGRNLCLVQ